MGSDPQRDVVSSRYELLLRLASGGMATVFIGRIRAAGGFTRLVAIKRAHPEITRDPVARAGIVEEARLASKLHHPNVVAVQDVEDLDGELLLVMDYVEGGSLAQLVTAANAADAPLEPAVCVRILLDACAGLHAAHDLTDDFGAPMPLVHRDVSPQNVLIGLDGVARLTDFGIAKGSGDRAMVRTVTGALKGKLAYMAPEYVLGEPFDARADVWAMGVVAWELLANARLFRGANEADTLKRVVEAPIPSLLESDASLPPDLDEVVRTALARSPSARFATALAFGRALETAARRAGLVAETATVAERVKQLLGGEIMRRRSSLRDRASGVASPAAASNQSPAAVDAGARQTQDAGGTDSVTVPVSGDPHGSVDAVIEGMQELSTLGASGVSRPDARSGAIAPRRRSWPWALVVGSLTAGGAVAVWIFGPPTTAAPPDSTQQAAVDAPAATLHAPASAASASSPVAVESAALDTSARSAAAEPPSSATSAPAKEPKRRPSPPAVPTTSPVAPPPASSPKAPPADAPKPQPTFAPNPYGTANK